MSACYTCGMPDSEGIRLQKVLAAAGIASRRAAENLIVAGRVQVNGRIETRLGALAHPDRDIIQVDGREVRPAAEHQYLMLHKPIGMVTTTRDPAGRPTVLEALGTPSITGAARPAARVYPVGRLDWDSSGLLILTDDGDLTYRISHPRFHLEKEYVVDVVGHPAAELDRLRAGVWLDRHRTAPAQIVVASRRPEGTRLHVTLREGRNRQIRRMFDLVGYPVRALKRTRIGPLRLGDLPEGRWRFLNPAEVSELRSAVALPVEED